MGTDDILGGKCSSYANNQLHHQIHPRNVKSIRREAGSAAGENHQERGGCIAWLDVLILRRRQERCNEAFNELNKCVEDVNTANRDTVITSKLFDNYNRNVNYNLKAIGELKRPL